VLGLDYTDDFALVVNDITVKRLVILCYLTNRAWEARIYDVETAFFYGDLEELVYIRILQRFINFVENFDSKTYCLLLKKATYGLVQAAKQRWRKFISIMVEEFKLKKSQVDAYVLTRMKNMELSSSAFMLMMLSWLEIVQQLRNNHSAQNKGLSESCWTTFRIC
jgi:Reverse transcriptase (RNA-dependent DNA polymerase)